uniref:Uncharacterized protein n=1 Tax=Glossina pallidipes TaxID=7398 RepID=A0A1A9ZL94_GLOPL
MFLKNGENVTRPPAPSIHGNYLLQCSAMIRSTIGGDARFTCAGAKSSIEKEENLMNIKRIPHGGHPS